MQNWKQNWHMLIKKNSKAKRLAQWKSIYQSFHKGKCNRVSHKLGATQEQATNLEYCIMKISAYKNGNIDEMHP